MSPLSGFCNFPFAVLSWDSVIFGFLGNLVKPTVGFILCMWSRRASLSKFPTCFSMTLGVVSSRRDTHTP